MCGLARQVGVARAGAHVRFLAQMRLQLIFSVGACCSEISNCHLGRVTPLCAPCGSLADGVSWTAVSSVRHVDGLP